MKLFATVIALATSLLATASLAAPVTYTINPTTLSDGSVLSGSFVYDAAQADPLISVAITETGATPTTYGFVGAGPDAFYRMAQQTAVVNPGDRVAYFFVNNLTPGSYSGSIVGTATCDVITAGRCEDGTTIGDGLAAAAVPTTIPTMSEWALILFGLALAGSAALIVQRRRLFN